MSAAEQSGQHAGRHDTPPAHAIVLHMHDAPVAGGAGRGASGRTRGHPRRRRAVRRPAPLLVDELPRVPGEQRAVVDRLARLRPLRRGRLHRPVRLLARRGPGPAGVAGRQRSALRPPPHLAHPAPVLAGADLQPAHGVARSCPSRARASRRRGPWWCSAPAAGRRGSPSPNGAFWSIADRDAAVPVFPPPVPPRPPDGHARHARRRRAPWSLFIGTVRGALPLVHLFVRFTPQFALLSPWASSPPASWWPSRRATAAVAWLPLADRVRARSRSVIAAKGSVWTIDTTTGSTSPCGPRSPCSSRRSATGGPTRPSGFLDVPASAASARSPTAST